LRLPKRGNRKQIKEPEAREKGERGEIDVMLVVGRSFALRTGRSLHPLAYYLLQTIMDGYDFDAVARTIKIEDITADEVNREILRRLKENDPEFDWIVVSRNRVSRSRGDAADEFYYCPKGADEWRWLGYFIGKNAILEDLYLQLNPFEQFSTCALETFILGNVARYSAGG
jgi:hypothetical protein